MASENQETHDLKQMQNVANESPSLAAAQLSALDNSIIDAKARVKQVHIKKRNQLVMALFLASIVGFHFGKVFTLPSFVVIGLGALAVLSFFSVLAIDAEKPQSEVEKLEKTKRMYYSFLNLKTDEGYFDQLVKINIENLSDYYALVKIHTAQSFRLSLVVSVAGFFIIAAGLVAGFLNESMRNISYLSAGSGVIVEFIAGVMFYLYSKTVRQLKAYHDSLIDVQNILLSSKLIEGIDDEKERLAMTKQLMELLAGRRINSKDK
jgi:hypothetical protein